MCTTELKERLLKSKFINKNGGVNTYVHKEDYIKKNNLTEFRKEILNSVKFTNDLTECIYCILNDVKCRPTCECGNPVEFEMPTRGYRKYCSVKCRANSKEWEESKQKTNLLKYGVRHVAQQDHERKNRSTQMKNMDRSNIDYTAKSKKYKETMLSKYNGANSGWLSNGRLTRIKNGYNAKDKELYKQYRHDVDYLTSKQDVSKLENYDKRDNHCRNDNAYHLDHIVSVVECFNNNISPEVCASLHNLRFIHWKENLSKWARSDMSVNKLLELYNESKI